MGITLKCPSSRANAAGSLKKVARRLLILGLVAGPVIFFDFSGPYSTFAAAPRVSRGPIRAGDAELEIRTLQLSLVVIDLSDLTVSDISWAALRHLGTPLEEVIGQPASTALPGDAGTAHALQGMRQGAIDFYRGHATWVRAFTVGDRRVAVAETSTAGAAALTGYLGRDPAAMVYGTTTIAWVVRSLSDELEQLLGGIPANYLGHNMLETLGEENARTFLLASDHVGRDNSVSVPLEVHDISGLTQPLLFVVTLLAASNDLAFLLVRDETAHVTPGLAGLTSRQADVLRRLMRGERVPMIAEGLFISQSTVRNHLAAIFEHFGVHTQAELLKFLGGSGS